MKQRAVYSDCLEAEGEVVCHIPRNVDWRNESWQRLCEAQAIVLSLRDFPPEELEVWLKHAQEARTRGADTRNMLVGLHRELVERGFLKEGSWKPLLADIEEHGEVGGESNSS